MATTTATNTAQTEEHVSLKLLLNEKGNKVLFAEAGKDFVDILCSFLTMPLGTIARLVEKESSIGPVSVGCLNSLYHGLADMDQGCFCTDTIKQMLLEPINSAEDYCNTLKLNIDDSQPVKFFVCDNYTNGCSYPDMTISSYKDKHKCRCGKSFTLPVLFKHFLQGFVNSVASFVITDDLTVMPNCIDYTSLSLLQDFGIKNPCSVKEMVLNVTKEKVLDLLKCCLHSKSTLTDLFLGKKPSIGSSRFFSSGVEISGTIQLVLKLVIRKSDGKVLYAQAEQDFTDLLLSFLTYPLGGIARIFGEDCSLGSINSLYKSIADLNGNKYLISQQAKNRLVNPCIAPHKQAKYSYVHCIPPHIMLRKQIFPILKPGLHEYYGYLDSNYRICAVFNKPGENPSHAGGLQKLNFSIPTSTAGESYVKGPAMYVVTDDLVIAPLSPISALGLLKRFQTPLNDLKEKVVTIGVKECLSILKAALTSKSALTNGLAHLLTEVKEEK